MPQMRMKLDRVPVQGRNHALGALIDVDDETGRALAHLNIAEYTNKTPTVEPTYRAVLQPSIEKIIADDMANSPGAKRVAAKMERDFIEAVTGPIKRKRGRPPKAR